MAKMPAACLLTAFTVKNGRCAIAPLDRPSAISASTSRSRGVSRVTGSAREGRVISAWAYRRGGPGVPERAAGA